jgi:hypothetical protein
MSFIRSRFTSAHLIAMLALFVALGGSAFAFKLGKNSVRTKNIRAGAVTSEKLARNAVTTEKLVTDAVTSAKLATGAVTASKLGDAVVRLAMKPLPDASNVIVTARCAAGERVISGGGSVTASNSADIAFLASNPDTASAAEGAAPTGWTVNFNNDSGSTGTTTELAYAVCVK